MTMTAFAFLKWLKENWTLPLSTEKPCQPVSNSELRRWIEKKSVRINLTFPKADDILTLPITDLVFHPKGHKKCTMW